MSKPDLSCPDKYDGHEYRYRDDFDYKSHGPECGDDGDCWEFATRHQPHCSCCGSQTHTVRPGKSQCPVCG